MLKQFSFILIYLLLLLPGAQNKGVAAATPTLPTDSSVRFIANEGQWPSSARFQATTRDGVLWLTDDGLWLTRTTPEQGQINIHLSFSGLNAAARWEPFDPQETVVSYFHGQDPEQWQGGVPVWGGVLVHDLVPGADLRLTGQHGQLVTEWVATGDVTQITMQVEGADEVQQRGRELHFLTPAGSLTWPLPTSPTPLQLNITSATNELNIPLSTQPSALISQYSVLSTQYASSGSPLIFGTFIGGEDVLPDVPHAIALDPQGNIYTTGYTESPVFPTEPGLTPQHGIDVIITKLLPDGSDLAYAIHINPSAFNQPDWGYDLLVNNAGEAYVVGETNSFDFPLTPDALDNTFDDGEAFFLKVAADGASLLYSTFLGGADLDGLRSLAQDSAGNFYVTGQTWSLDFPTTAGAYDGIHNGARDAFVTKLNPTGTAILYSTFLGGDTQEQGQAIGVTADGQATITGWTNSTNYPTTSGAWDETFSGVFDVFVTRLNSSGSSLSYSTFIGGDNEDRGNSLVLHNDGRVTLTGTTLCPCPNPFPTTAEPTTKRPMATMMVLLPN
ncbi:MAG: SBBP repeat-containing protein [Chloroflexi bacterium]|nr:SBBP repeat-containing protein [Chloroflexota bacterium]